MSTGFTAAHSGRCGNCGELFPAGTQVFYDDGDRLLVEDCCGDFGGDSSERVNERPVQADKVMPRGRTARDRCDRCFQVPASNGVCGCN